MRGFLAFVGAAVVYALGQMEGRPPDPVRHTLAPPPVVTSAVEIPLQGKPVQPLQGWLGPAVAEAAREQVQPQVSQQCGPEGCFVRPTPRAPASPPVAPATPVQRTFVSHGACSGGSCGVSRPGLFGRLFRR